MSERFGAGRDFRLASALGEATSACRPQGQTAGTFCPGLGDPPAAGFWTEGRVNESRLSEEQLRAILARSVAHSPTSVPEPQARHPQ